jgi:hypothetical protein
MSARYILARRWSFFDGGFDRGPNLVQELWNAAAKGNMKVVRFILAEVWKRQVRGRLQLSTRKTEGRSPRDKQ